MLRFVRYVIEVIAGFIAVAIVLTFLLAWRLSTKPVSSDFMTPYIETGIESLVPGSDVHLGSTLLTWSGPERAISVHAENIKIDDAAGGEIANIPSFDAKISALGIIFGQFMPKELLIDHPQVKLRHVKEGFTFGGMAVNKSHGGAQQPSGGIASVLGNFSDHLSHATLMHKLAVTRAVFDVHDDVTQQDWSVSVPEISITRNSLESLEHTLEWGSLEGHITIAVTQQETLASLDLRYTYNPSTKRHSLSTVFSDLTPAFFAGGHPETLGLGDASIIDMPLTGNIKLTFDENFELETVGAQIHGDEGQLIYPDFWEKPCPVKSFDTTATFDRENRAIDISDTHIDLDGPVLSLKVSGKASKQQGQDIDFKAMLTVDNMPMNSYSALWPKPLLPDPRYWLEANLRDGIFKHAEASLNGTLALNDLANLSITEGGGKLAATDGRVTYLDGMPPAENVNATATFDLKQMNVMITSGNIGNIRLSPFPIEITGLADPDQDIDIPLQVGGPIPEVLSLLDHQPLGYAKKLGLSPDDIGGKIDGAVHFRFPLLKSLKTKDLDIKATATATGVSSTKLVPGIAIDQGNLGFTLDMSGFGFKGQTLLNKIPFQVEWQENFEEQAGKPLRHALVTGVVRDDQWNNFGIKSLNGTKGPIDVVLDITTPSKSKTLYNGTLDMTPAAVQLDLLNWKKPANVPAFLKFTASAVGDKPVNVSSFVLHGPQIQANGNAVMTPDMSQFLALNISPLTLGRSNASLHLAQTFGPSGSLRCDVSGSSFDITGLRAQSSDQPDLRPQDYHIQLDKLYTSATGVIDQAQGSASRDQQGWRAISLHGMTGATPLSIELTPQPDGHRTLAITSDNFGEMMKGLGFTDTIKGGKFAVSGQSTPDNPGLITGKAKIVDFTVIKLPVLALLLNATSPFGFIGILTDSTDFSRFQGEFHWQGDDLVLTKAHAAGSAIGINIDGKVNLNSGDANLQGTLVPFSVVNNILNYIPLIGDLLTGGQDQGVLAVSYQINGPLNAPKISVNPVSLLTPGFIRNLFFRDDAADDDEP